MALVKKTLKIFRVLLTSATMALVKVGFDLLKKKKFMVKDSTNYFEICKSKHEEWWKHPKIRLKECHHGTL